MISSLTGELRKVGESRIELEAGPIGYELLVPAADLAELQAHVGQLLTFHTIFYLEGDAARGNLEPRLIGFIRPDDREFFQKFTTVKGIGPRTALRALSVPIGDIAQAIESKDSRFLVQLDGIGKRTAELIVAELSGKVRKFAAGPHGAVPSAKATHSPTEQDAIAALMALDDRLRRPEVEMLLERARQAKPALTTTDGLLREMLRLRSIRA